MRNELLQNPEKCLKLVSSVTPLSLPCPLACMTNGLAVYTCRSNEKYDNKCVDMLSNKYKNMGLPFSKTLLLFRTL